MLSVICPVYNEEKYLSQFLDSLLRQDYLGERTSIEILLVDGRSTDRTRQIAAGYTSRYPFIRLIDNPGRTAPCAMNTGIAAARGDIIIRLDAHAYYPENYFSVLCKYLTELNADNVGAPCRTDVLHKTPVSLAIREVLCHPFGVGNSVFRLGVNEVKQVDTVPFGCWKKDCFTRFGLFNENLTRNQDYELNRRITDGGGKIYIVPDTYSVYYARETFAGLWKQGYLNGIWGIRTIAFTHKGTLALRHFIPALFVLSLIVPSLAALACRPLSLVSAASLAAYLMAVCFFSLRAGSKKHLNFFYLVLAFTVQHLSNGCGMLVSLFTTPRYVKKHTKNGNGQ